MLLNFFGRYFYLILYFGEFSVTYQKINDGFVNHYRLKAVASITLAKQIKEMNLKRIVINLLILLNQFPLLNIFFYYSPRKTITISEKE